MKRSDLSDIAVAKRSGHCSAQTLFDTNSHIVIKRENHGLTQTRLGEILGGVPRQHVSNMEREVRSISLKTARKLAQIFQVSPEKFV